MERRATKQGAAVREEKQAGVFITFEGVDGCGKSTQAAHLVAALKMSGREVISLREPGSTRLSEKIRNLLLDPANTEMCAECELMLYEASRAQLVRQAIEPALSSGAIVVCDRFFDSTYAYQAGGRGLAEDVVQSANALGSCGHIPDATVLLDLPVELSYERVARGRADRMEAAGMSFQQRVRDCYLRLAASDPGRIRVVDASGEPAEVSRRVIAAVLDVLPELASPRLSGEEGPMSAGRGEGDRDRHA